MIVVDASAALELLLVTPVGRRLQQRLLAPGETLHAPHVFDLEIAQVLRRYCSTRTLTPSRAEEALDDLGALPLARYPHDVLLARIWELRGNLTAYDAAYVALAEALAAPLVTCDSKLAATPGHVASIELF